MPDDGMALAIGEAVAVGPGRVALIWNLGGLRRKGQASICMSPQTEIA